MTRRNHVSQELGGGGGGNVPSKGFKASARLERDEFAQGPERPG